MKLTNRKKRAAYLYAIEGVLDGRPHICNLVLQFIKVSPYLGEEYSFLTATEKTKFLEETFPELMMFDPMKKYGYQSIWLEGTQFSHEEIREMRLTILSFCLKLVNEDEEVKQISEPTV